jgi:tetratricopeptide (TPR) repeat protein
MARDIIDNEKELQLLFQSLKRAKGFHLYLVQGNNPRVRMEILDSLKKLLETAGIIFYQHHLKKPISSLDDLLPPGFADREKEKAVLVVSGLENSFIDTGAPQFLLHRLNYSRDLLPKKIPVPLVLWLPVGALKKILTEAHDLWSWRSGTFYFYTPTEMIEGQFQEMAVLREQETRAAIPEKLYRERLVLFTGLLEDLTSRDGSQKIQLQQADVMQQISELHHSYAVNIIKPVQRTGLLEKALEFQIQALEIKQSILDRVHPDVGRCYGNLSAIHRGLGHLEKALEFQLKDIAILEQVLDKNHPSLALSYNSLSRVYWDLGQLEQALKFQLKAIEIREKVFDKNHPDLADSYNNVSIIYRALGQLEQAMKLQLKTIEIREKVFDKNNPDLAQAYNNISLIFLDLGQLEEALEFQLNALAIIEQVLPKNHPDLANSYHNLSWIYRDMKDFPKALTYAQKSVDIYKHHFPNGHPNLETALKNMEALKEKLSQ